MTLARILAVAVAALICAYLLLIFLGVAGCSTSGSGAGNARTGQEP